MTCVNSFWASLVNNFKRRIWVWALCIFANLMAYPAVLTVYFTRIDKYLSYGNYTTTAAYKQALVGVVLDMFNGYTRYVPMILAVIVGIQGFSYLFSKRKVDMYHAVPVSSKKRFLTIYVNGILAYIVSMLFAMIITIVMIAAKGILLKDLMAKFGLLVLMCILVFLAVYNISVWVATITGNLFTAVVIDGVVIFYVSMWLSIVNSYRSDFYNTLCTVFSDSDRVWSLIDLYTNSVWKITIIGAAWSEIIPDVWANVWKLIVWIVIPFILAYIDFRKRPAEAAGKSIAFYSSRIIIKLMIAVPVALMLGRWMYYYAEQNITLMIVCLIAGTIIISLLIEMLFNLDFLSAFSHWGSIVVALIMVMGFFLFFKLDVIRYDSYIPEASEIETYAIYNENEGYYSDSIDFAKENADDAFIDAPMYARENMFLCDSEAIVELAKKSQQIDSDNMECPISIDVYYRLKSGKNRSRTIWVDLCDKGNDALLNRIVGPAYYKEGVWQAMTMDVPAGVRIYNVQYYDGGVTRQLSIDQANEIVRIWRSDMEKYDYNIVRYDDELGYISIIYENYNSWNLPVYKCFDETVAYLNANIGDIDTELPIEAIDSINVSYYGNDSYTEYNYDSQSDIKTIMAASYKYPTHTGWKPWNEDATDYGLEINLTAEYIKTYNTFSLYSYRICSDKIDDLRTQIGLP